MSIFSRRTQPAPMTITHEVLDAIRTSPPIIAAVADAAARKVAARRQLITALTVLERDAEKNFPGLIAASDAAFAGEKAAAAALHNARRQVDLATGNRINASVALDRGREQLVSELTAGADNRAIDDFIADMRDEVELARKAFAYWPFDEVNKITGRRRHGVLNNAESVAARISACNEAAASAEALRLAPDQASVPAALAALSAALPGVTDVPLGAPAPKPEPKPKIGGLAAMRDRSKPPADGPTLKAHDAQ